MMDSFLTAQVSTAACQHNLKLIRQLLSPRVKLCAAVKANAYGHGLAELFSLFSRHVDYLAVATPEEALNVRRWGYTGAVLIFFSSFACAVGSARLRLFAELISQGIDLTIVSIQEIPILVEASKCAGLPARVQIKVDSGMGRSGIGLDSAPKLIHQVRSSPALNLVGIYTHFAVAEEADKTYTRKQLQNFMNAVDQGGGRLGTLLHAANSAATIDMPETHLDMVRPGLALYGYQPSNQLQNHLPLRPILRVTGRLMQVRSVPAGTRCGYGLRYEFSADGRIGLVPIGYGDGYLRALSGRGVVGIHGQWVPVCGTISMDQIIINLTEVPNAKVGDEVEIISADPAAPNSVENLALIASTIPYEITCRLGPRIHRVVVP